MSAPIVTMQVFNTKRYGRAGNQMLQYAFLRAYCQKYGAQLQLPPWVGNQLFGASEPPVTTQLPAYEERTDKESNRQGIPPEGDELLNHDFHGYAQYHTGYLQSLADASQIRSWFQPTPEVAARMAPAVERLRVESSQTVVGLHIRRGDYGRRHFSLAPTEWFHRWLHDHWWAYFSDGLPPRLLIATEDPSLVDAFGEYNPETAVTLGVTLANEPMANYNYLPRDVQTKDPVAMDWYPDFHLLSQCDVLVTSNSTFSFVAGMLNTKLQEFWRASLPVGGFELIQPWQAFPLLRHNVRDFPHLKGITTSTSLYW